MDLVQFLDHMAERYFDRLALLFKLGFKYVTWRELLKN